MSRMTEAIMEQKLSSEESERPAKRARVETEEVPDVNRVLSVCSTCDVFFGHTNGQCSWCSVGRVGNITPDTMFAEDINRWIETGFHTKNIQGQCSVCLEHKLLDSNFCCNCEPTICLECNTVLNLCPTCQSGKYVRMQLGHIRSLLLSSFHSRSILGIVRDLRKTKQIADDIPFSFQRLVCPVSEIDEVTRELDLDTTDRVAAANCNALHTIYCFAPDYFNTQSNGSHFILCFKNFGMDRMPKTYRHICESKNMVCAGAVNLMETVVDHSG